MSTHDPDAPGRDGLQMPGQRRACLLGRDAGGYAQVQPSACPGDDRRRRAHHRWGVDGHDGQRRPGPQHVGHGAVTEQRHPVQQSGVAAELIRRIGLSRPRPARGQAVDGEVPAFVPQAREHDHERRQAVGSGTPEDPAVHLRPECLHGDDRIDDSAQAHRDAGASDRCVAGVGDQDDVGAQEISVLGNELLQPTRALLLGALDDHLEVDGHVVAEGAQRGEVRHDVALAVGGAPAVPAAVDGREAKRRCAPGVVVQRGLHVVVGVQQHGRGVPVGARPRPDHRTAPVGHLDEPDVREADAGEVLGHPIRGALALLRRELARVGDRAEGDEFGELLAGPRHVVGDPDAQVVDAGR